ncbi:MAG: class I SAM-dependent methyltransferase [Bradyrhizobium sp.]|nr:MAG: class I SAM-dependent methyltransferase [Bradyrhizobium sp.]
MSRTERILEGVTKDMRGIEVAPWFAPLAPKRQGFNCLTLDIFDRETLIQRAKADPNIPRDGADAIEAVDLVGNASEIEALVPARDHGAFDYVVSSHNFEHLPNPIKFLQGCSRVLKPGGLLSMAVPDGRACFDFFRPHTTVGDWLLAYRDARIKPSADQLFQSRAYRSALRNDGKDLYAFSIQDDPARVTMTGDLDEAYRAWLSTTEADPYVDAHCSVMTPASFELLIEECRHLGLTSFACVSVSEPVGCEFYVRLVNKAEASSSGDFNAIRTGLAHRIWSERAAAAVNAADRTAPSPGRIAKPEAGVKVALSTSANKLDRRPEPSFRKKLSLRYIHPLKKRIDEFRESIG